MFFVYVFHIFHNIQLLLNVILISRHSFLLNKVLSKQDVKKIWGLGDMEFSARGYCIGLGRTGRGLGADWARTGRGLTAD